MPNPFPGMNPYLESPDFWPEVHHLLISAIKESLTPQLRPKYRVAIEKRIYEIQGENSVLVAIPDVSIQQKRYPTNPVSSNVVVASRTVEPLKVRIPVSEEFREGYLEVLDMTTKEVVTVIEVLSPANKRRGEGRQKYDNKRNKIFDSSTHLVEIDLLRGGEPLPVFGDSHESECRILVSRSNQRPIADLYLFNICDRIPAFPLPLRREDVEPVLDLQVLINQVYDRAGYDFEIDYTAEPVPPLSESNAVWANALLRETGLRA
ncbi:MAG: DUF4058 family protein [Microcoleus sp. CSU_2_2]|nr:DUF4058 family protein [Microcoleus sp. SU_5_3]NJS12320.1 DUF4058 family protein [Microcoleus sp. CSU_2_2]